MMKDRISARVKINGAQLFLVWLLTVLLPALIAVSAIEFLDLRHFEHAKILALNTANTQLKRFDNLLSCESFLQSKLSGFNKILQSQTSIKANELLMLTGKEAEIMPIYSVFRNKTNGQLFSASHRPADLQGLFLPPKLLLRRIFEEFSSEKDVHSSEFSRTVASNKLHFQQLFKTITTNILLKNVVLRNFSYYLGGEIFFLIIEVPEPNMISHALLVFRGKDIKPNKLVKYAASQIKNTEVLFLPDSGRISKSNPTGFFCGEFYDSRGISVYQPANQLFTRLCLHEGGTKLRTFPDKVAFLRHRTMFEEIRSPFFLYKKQIRTAATAFVFLFSTLFLHLGLFGMNFSQSLKTRALAGIFLASFFPLGALSACMYLYRNYDNFISRLNLIQHIELRIAQNSERLTQKVTEFENFLKNQIDLSPELSSCSEKQFLSFAQKLGKYVPFSQMSYISENANFSYQIPERCHAFDSNGNDVVWSFFPTNIIRWLKEDGRENRTPQHIFNIAGTPLRAGFLNSSMKSTGRLYMFSQGTSPIWLSVNSIFAPGMGKKEISAIIHSKFELGPILQSYYTERSESLFETVGNYRVDFGFFPLKQLSNNDFWQGGYDASKKELFSKYKNFNQNQQIIEPDGSALAIVNINHGFMHKVIAVATPIAGQEILSWPLFALGGSIYISLILFFASRLLDHFFILPILAMAKNAEKIARGGDEWCLTLETGDELQNLNRSFSGMVDGLRQRNALKDYVSDTAFSEIEKNVHSDLFPGGEYCEASILFASIKSNAANTSTATSVEILERIDRFFEDCESCCRKRSGNIDKVIEQTIMMVFRSQPGSLENHSLAAAAAALELKNKLAGRNLQIQAGVASGKVISGRIGSYTGKLDFTVIGDTVNLASRLKNEAAQSNTGIIVSGSAMRMLKGKARVSFLRRCSIKGKSREFNIYELTELRAD